MPGRGVEFAAGSCYHLYNRGNNRQTIFFHPENYAFFVRRLRLYLDPVADVVAYCLMLTHYHLLVQLTADGLSRAMQGFGVSYTKAINASYERVGSLLQGRFQARLVDRDEYLLHLSRYIHLNPVKAGIVVHPEDWEYSSYPEYLGLRNGTLPKPGLVLDQFPSREAYREFVEAFAGIEPEGLEDLLLD